MTHKTLWASLVALASTSALASGADTNPYAAQPGYTDPAFTAHVKATAERYPQLAEQMLSYQFNSTAVWLDRIAKLPAIRPALALAKARNQVVTFVVYDLPERDCAAKSSNGELHINDHGWAKYQGYIDEIAKAFAEYPDQPIAAIIEPDSLGNIVTNTNIQKCANAVQTYRDGVAYAVRRLAQQHVSVYLDSGHSGWLGWENNRRSMARVVREVLDQAGGPGLIRGFSTNVSNYSPLDFAGTPDWYANTWNPARGEINFAQLMGQSYAEAGIYNHQFVIDTSRNGVVDSRKIWGSWCNVQRAGLGTPPAAATAYGIDAYLWIKTPGESDGTNDQSAPRFDDNCVSSDAFTDRAVPEAGDWFMDGFASLISKKP